MFFISKKRFREEVERELAEKMEDRNYRMAMDTEVSRIYDRIMRIENRVAILENKDGVKTNLPY